MRALEGREKRREGEYEPEDSVVMMNAFSQTTEGKVTGKASWEELATKVGEL